MSKKTLSLSLRPKKFGEVVGQEHVISSIKNQVKSRRMPAAWLFAGSPGTGKTTLAKIIARSLQCKHRPFGSPCHTCREAEFCINEVNAAEYNGVEAMKELAQTSEFAPTSGKYRVIILNEAQRLTSQAQSVLLDYFERVPKTTCWILTTTMPNKILDALRSRCVMFNTNPIRGRTLEDFIKDSAKKAKISKPQLDEFINTCHEQDVSSARLALMALERWASGMDPETAITAADVAANNGRVCRALCNGDFGPIRSELEKAGKGAAKHIQAAVMGYLRGVMLNRSTNLDKKIVADTILALGNLHNYDESLLDSMLAAVLYKASKKF